MSGENEGKAAKSPFSSLRNGCKWWVEVYLQFVPAQLVQVGIFVAKLI